MYILNKRTLCITPTGLKPIRRGGGGDFPGFRCKQCAGGRYSYVNLWFKISSNKKIFGVFSKFWSVVVSVIFLFFQNIIWSLFIFSFLYFLFLSIRRTTFLSFRKVFSFSYIFFLSKSFATA